MNRKRDTKLLLRIVLRIMLIGIVVTLGVLTVTMPRISQPRSAFFLLIGLSFLAAGIFSDSWWADVFGMRQTPIFRQYGTRGARVVFLFLGLCFIVVGGASLLF